MVFQRKLRRETLAFRQRKLKDTEDDDVADQESDPDFIDPSDANKDDEIKETIEDTDGQSLTEQPKATEKPKTAKKLKPGIARLKTFTQEKYGTEKHGGEKEDQS